MYNIIGKKIKRIDGYEKVTGKAIYGDDIYLKGMLYAACRYTDIPAGKISKIDISEAKNIKGVEAIALYKDIPGEKRLGPIRKDQYAIIKDEVFYSGDVIAVVAAQTKDITYAACEAIKVEYKSYTSVNNPEDSIKPETRLIHPEFKSNVVVHYPLVKGNIKQGFEESDHIIERVYKTGFVEHAYIEPESVTVIPDPTTKGYKVYGSIQNPYTTRKTVALFMGLNLNRINVFGSTLGGSFGGKDDVINMMACRAALLAKITDKPVKLTNTREDSIKESYKRHPYIMKYKAGFNKNGKLKAMKIDILADSGAYSSQSFFVTWRSVVQATGPYEIENIQTDIKAVYTNNCYTAAFRGFGSPQIIFAQESLMDEIAEICGISPLEIRQINGYGQGSITASGQKLSGHKVSLLQVIKEAVKKSNYKNQIKKFQELNKINKRYKLGIGLSCSFRGCSLGAEGTDATSAIVSVQADGSVYVLAGLNENGQGLRTSFCQIASEVLGVDIDKVVFLEPQTATITDGGPTVASRSTLMGGKATLQAAEEVKKVIFKVIKKDLKVENIEDTIWAKGFIKRNKPAENIKPIKFEDAAEKAYGAGLNLSAYGWYSSPEVSWEESTGQGNAYFTYVYGCQVAEIEVDTFTGKINILNITAAHDVGKVINRLGAEGQVFGGVAQGIGYGILEDFNIQNGEVKSNNFDEYLIPTIKDINHIEPVLIENPDKFGPFGAKSLGEPTLELTSAAINNALAFATKKRSYQIPLTLEQVFLGKNLKKPSRQSEDIHLSKNKKLSPKISNIKITTPASLDESIDILNKKKCKILAGGTDLIIRLRMKSEQQELLNIYNLPQLKGITENNSGISIGSLVTFSEIIKNKIIVTNFPVLVKACSLIGSPQIRNRATIGGNIVNAAPCADAVPPLILYNAKLILKSQKGTREIKIQDFIIKSYQTKIKPDEILVSIKVPKPEKKYYYSYFQLGRRNALNITRMSISAIVSLDKNNLVEECRLVDGSLFSHSQRLTVIEDLITGKELNNIIISEIEKPLFELINREIGNRWSSEYKMPVFINLVKSVLKDIKDKIGKS
jgi:CO/xanthine dehydrogenase Mo-binding subunit/CO/xanthine dehydrogenase FAD-binding subunit